MKRKMHILIMLVLASCFMFGTGMALDSEQPQDLEVNIIIPPVISRAVEFPVIAEVTNVKDKGNVKLNKAEWNDGEKKVVTELDKELPAGKQSKQDVDRLRSKKSSLSEVEESTLKTQYEKLKQSKHYIRFTVTQEMAEQIKSKGSIVLNLKIDAISIADHKAVSIDKGVTLKSGRIPQRPEVAPGAHHSDWYFGDTHSHSTYTWDYYIGDGIYTIPELKNLAKAAGLDWLVLTDHSYCLDSTKYNTQKNTVTSLSDSTFAFLYGEELSVAELVNGSKAYDTAHYNGIMNTNFISSVTDLFRKASSPDSQQGINYIKQNGGLVTINHPNWGTGSFEAWNFNINTYPYTHGETGMEILNGAWSDTNNGSTTRWVDRRLLKGEKVFPFAGSDTESSNHFGESYTVVYADYLTQSNIKQNLGLGHQYVTTSPGLSFWARKSGTTAWSWMGDTLTMGNGTAEFFLSYADSYDGLHISVMKGKAGWTSEQQVYSTTTAAGSGTLTINASVEPGSYLRVYCKEIIDDKYRAYTAPIWFN